MNDPRSPVAPSVAPTSEPLLEAPAAFAQPPPSPAAAPSADAPIDRPNAVSSDPPTIGDGGSALWIGFLAGLALLLAGFIWLALIAVPPGG